MGLYEELEWRGLVQQCSDPELPARLGAGKMTGYVGFDPSAASLHVGSLLPIISLVRVQRSGHRPIALVGGATGLIGDPSGKSEERKLLTEEAVAANVAGIRRQLERFLDFSAKDGALLVDNIEWFRRMGYLEFLRDVGKLFSVNAMLAKDSVRSRLEEREQGISYTEFSYQLLQAYDFLQLFERHGCRLQLGGSDQWGNITAGIDLVRRLRQETVYGLTMPLITTADGKKLGKTEAGAVWLDADRTSPYLLYQYFLRTDDRDVGRFLRFFTFLGREPIEALEREAAAAPERREAQRTLAREVTTLVHGKGATTQAEQAAEALFGGELANLDERTIADVFSAAPSVELPRAELDTSPRVVDLLVRTGASPSNGAARRDIEGGGVYLNNRRVDAAGATAGPGDLLAQRYLVLRKGKKSYYLVRIV